MKKRRKERENYNLVKLDLKEYWLVNKEYNMLVSLSIDNKESDRKKNFSPHVCLLLGKLLFFKNIFLAKNMIKSQN